jgi:imidazolonepropionase
MEEVPAMAPCELRECDRVWVGAHLATFDPAVEAPCGALRDHALGVKDGRIAAIVPMSSGIAARLPDEVHEVRGGWLTPGFIDCHTHLIHGGSRAREFEMRLAGISYAEIARRGGGILSTVRETRKLGAEELVRAALPRLAALAREGVTCVEVKSGYGLTVEDELKMLRAARSLPEVCPVEVSPTLLAAHALPPEFEGRADDYIDLVCEEMIPRAAAGGLAEAVDVFCEGIAFSPAQCERVFAVTRRHGLAIKGHVGQLSDLGGAGLVARWGGWSADHLEHLDGDGVRALASAGTVAVLLPGAHYSLRETRKPPVEDLRAAGVPIAVATDLNPGTAPFASIRLAMNMACTLFGLTPEEALAGITRHAARALARLDRLGTLTVGKQADLLWWEIGEPAELAAQVGVNPLRQRVIRGGICDAPTA